VFQRADSVGGLLRPTRHGQMRPHRDLGEQGSMLGLAEPVLGNAVQAVSGGGRPVVRLQAR
jgi:hypothetical protein